MNGWVHTLEETEIAFLCMLADLRARQDSDWVRISERDRLGLYGLGHDAYRAHQLLSLCGIVSVNVPEGRREDGTFEAYSDPGWGGAGAPPHRFMLYPDAFEQEALPAVLDALDRLSVSAAPPASTQRRPERYSPPGWRAHHYRERPRGTYPGDGRPNGPST